MDTSETSPPPPANVDQMLINAALRDELEPYADEAIAAGLTRMPIDVENEYLASMLAWERAPALPIRDWFDPPLCPPAPEHLSEDELRNVLASLIESLASQHVVLVHTDHLDDRSLYRIILRDILPATEKRLTLPEKKLRWQCVEDAETFLRYYADPVERRRYQEEHCCELPPVEPPPHPRRLPS